MTNGAIDPVEPIPSTDEIARSLVRIPSEIDPRATIRFDYDKKRDERALSAIWRKYAPSIADVHACGNEITNEINTGIQAKGGQLAEYLGFFQVAVAAVRGIQVKDSEGKGYGLDMLHLPRPGQRWHAHISIVPPPGKNPQKIHPTVRGELRERLFAVLGSLQPY